MPRTPNHIAIVMDGNGRWAESRGLDRSAGHEAGADAVRKAVRFCRKRGVAALSLFAFSAQNWARPEPEVGALMRLLMRFVQDERAELLRTGVRFRVIGRRAQLPPVIQEAIAALEAETSQGEPAMTLSVAISYGGQEELADAAQTLCEEVASGRLKPEAVTTERLAAALPSMDVGPVDLLIRTGGEVRISNFLIWGAAYAELFFSPAMWPDFDETNMEAALDAYTSRERRFGQVVSGVPSPEQAV